MKYVYILENDSKSIGEIIEALAAIDPQIKPRVFYSLETFANWIQTLAKEGKKAIAVGGFAPDETPAQPNQNLHVAPAEDDQLLLLVSNNDILGKSHLPLLRKTQDLFISHGLCTRENPTSLVITAFDSPDFDAKTIEARLVNNVIIKPFDKMILRQHLIFAISGRQPPTTFTLHNQKTSAIIEMLKDVDVEAFSDVGFITRSTSALPVGAVAKYYGDIFKAGSTRSVFAKCIQCEPHPEIPNSFLCGFTYFGTEPEQISIFRKNAIATASKNHEQEFKYSWVVRRKSQIVNIAIIDPEEFGTASLGGTLERNFSNVRIFKYKNMIDFVTDVDPQSRPKAEKQTPAFPGGKIKMFFDSKTHKVLKVEPALSPGQSILGMTAGEFEKVDLFHWIPESQRPKLMSMIKGQFKSAEESFLVLPNGELEFFIRSEGIRMMKSDKGAEMVEVSFAEMTENERNKQLEKLSQLPRVVHGVIASDAFVGSELDRWQNIKEMLGKRGASSPDGKGIKPEFFVVAKTRKTDPLLRLDAAFFSDIFYRPVERSYFVKKMYLFFSGLEVKDEEKIEIKQFHRHEKIEVGNPIKAVQISEAGLVMTYYRSIHIGSFRKFVLWFPMEVGLPIILGACNFTEEAAEEKGKFNNHFVFYGIRDFYLQHIRIWIRENYVSSKKDE